MFCGIDSDDAKNWFNSRVNNNIAGLISEALPGIMISLYFFSPMNVC